jgi:hypothetical protein
VTGRTTPKARGIRRVERWLVGVALAVAAFVLERLVMRSVKKKHPQPETAEPTTLRSKGGEVDIG